MGTLLGLLSAALVFLYPGALQYNGPWIGLGMIASAALLFFLNQWTQVSAWPSLVEASENSTSRLLDVVRKDPLHWFANLFLTFFPLLTLLALLFPYISPTLSPMQWAGIWFIGLGIALDLLYSASRQYLNFFNPFQLLKLLTRTAKQDVQNNKEVDLCETIEAISEIAIKGVDNFNIGLPIESLNELQDIAKEFLRSSRIIGHPTYDQEAEKMGIDDKLTYTLYFLYQRLELIFQKGLEARLEPVCSAVITTLGKIGYYAAKVDVSLCGSPFSVIGRLAREAQIEQIPEVGVKATITLLEVTRLILDEVDLSYQELRDPFLILVNDLHEIAKEAYRQDKEIEIDLLKQPFKQIKELFGTEKMVNHPDTPFIIAKADQALAEFDALELILRTVPPLPNIPEEQK